KDAIDQLAEAEKQAHEAALSEIQSNNDETERLKLETQLVTASNRARAVMLAQLQAEQFIRNNKTPEADQGALIKSYVDAANAAVDLKQAQDKVTAATKAAEEAAKAQHDAFIQGLQDMQAAAQQTASMLSEAFGKVGEAFGKLLTAQTDYNTISMKIANDQAQGRKIEAGDIAALGRAETERNF